MPYDKVPRRRLRSMQSLSLLHLMTQRTALRWATVERAGHGYKVCAFDLRCNIEQYILVSSYRRAAVLAKKFAKEAQ